MYLCLSNAHFFVNIENLIFKHFGLAPMEDEDELREKLIELKREHRDLDEIIDRLTSHQPIDFLQLQRLKKRKLVLKDTIQKIDSQLLPDIIA